mmetsp:Transcript_46178/g.33956  ORF Transcript_46178/g.33956 Transcript_46178/m.33956 type:complete len:87 (+) Transcript_46178:231-491(+)
MGFVEQGGEPCRENLHCEKCKYEWTDPNLKVGSWEKKFMETKSELSKLLYGNPCPRCDVVIYKNGGCPHMTCKCKYEFCWYCLGKY